MNRELALMLLGGGIALVSALSAFYLSHVLSLRSDRTRRQRDKEQVAFHWSPTSDGQGARVVAVGKYLRPNDPTPEPGRQSGKSRKTRD